MSGPDIAILAAMALVAAMFMRALFTGILKCAIQREREKAQEAAARQLASSSRFCNPDVEWLEAHVARAEPLDAAAIERGEFIEQVRWDR